MKAVLQEKSTHIHARVQWSNTFMVCLLQVENCTSNCTQLYFVESIRKNFVLRDETGSCCNRELHSLFTSCSGLRSVFWSYSSMISAMTFACQLSSGTVLKKFLYICELNSSLVALGLMAGMSETWRRLPTSTALAESKGPTNGEMVLVLVSVT